MTLKEKLKEQILVDGEIDMYSQMLVRTKNLLTWKITALLN